MPQPRPLALVTGATRGIGAAVAAALADRHDLLIGGRDPVAVADACAGVGPGTARPFAVDLTDHGALTDAVRGIERLDVLVHSAGVSALGTVAETTVDTWRRQLEVNVVAVAELTRLLLPALRAARGHIIMINSGAGIEARPGWAAYAASKFALRAFADALRAEELANGVRVTSVHPGRVDTDMQREVVAQEGGQYRPERYLRPRTVAEAVRFAAEAPDDAALTQLVLRPAGPR